MSLHDKFFSLADLIDYELQMVLDSAMSPEARAARDRALLLAPQTLQAGKVSSLKAWLAPLRGTVGERFMQLRRLLLIALIAFGLLLGWATIRALLQNPDQHPVNILPFLAFFALVPLLFMLLLLGKGVLMRWLGRLPEGWASFSGHWLLSRVSKRSPIDERLPLLWHRLRSLHPRVFTLQAWILSQSFALAYYAAAAVALLFYVSINDYVFAWQSTLRLGPELMTQILHGLAAPFAWLGPALVPDPALIEATQFDRFAGRYLSAEGSSRAGAYWSYLLAVMISYGLIPRLLLLFYFQLRMHQTLRGLAFRDAASEELWLRLQQRAWNWSAQPGTAASSLQSPSPRPQLSKDKALVVVRWRQAPFADAELRHYFAKQGLEVRAILDAEGRDSELQTIPESLGAGAVLALVCDPWELPGEAFNRLRLALREKLSVATALFLVPLSASPDGPQLLPAAKDRELWLESLRAFRDPYVGLFQEGGHES